MTGYYDKTNPYWFLADDIYTAENKDRNRRIWGDANASHDALGLPVGTRSFKELTNPRTLWDESLKLAKADIDQAVTTWLPRNWDFDASAVEQSRINNEIARRLQDATAPTPLGATGKAGTLIRDKNATQALAKQITDEVAEKAATGAFKPTALRTAASVARQGAGKTLQTVGGVVLPVLDFAHEAGNGINPLEAGWRAFSEGLAGYAGGALGGAAGTATGPGAVVTAIAGATGGSMLMDKINDLIFGDEDKRIAEYKQNKQQEKAQANSIRAQRLHNAHQGYLASQYLTPELSNLIGTNNSLIDYQY